jgi:hypothetical protein
MASRSMLMLVSRVVSRSKLKRNLKVGSAVDSGCWTISPACHEVGDVRIELLAARLRDVGAFGHLGSLEVMAVRSSS